MNLEKITQKTRSWSPNLDIVLPIDGNDIPGFVKWVNWSGWKGYDEAHEAFDFAAYFTKENCRLGLPENTPVRAVADGYIAQISRGFGSGGYSEFINIEHAEEGSGLFSSYHHVSSKVKNGDKVKKGDVIATLHKDDGDEQGKLVHLHFELTNGWNYGSKRQRVVNPELIYSSISDYKAEPQGDQIFKINGLDIQPQIVIANFRKLLVDNKKI